MSRKMSKAAKAAEYDVVASERSRWAEMTWMLVNHYPPDAVESFIHDGDVYEFRLYGALRGHGGLLMQVFRSDVNQHASVELYVFDAWARDVAGLPFTDHTTEVKIVAEKLARHRSGLFAAERAS